MLVSAPDTNGEIGAVHAYSGLDGTLLWTAVGESSCGKFGYELSPLGDVTLDGIPDVAVCAFGYGPSGNTRGRVYVLDGLDGSVIVKIHGDDSRWHLGLRMDAAGDFNNDGMPDLIVATQHARTLGSSTGIVRVYSGATGALLFEETGYQSHTNFGCDVSAAGDINFDGYDDIIVGAEAYAFFGTSRGAAFIYSGKDSSILQEFHGVNDFDFFGSSVDAQGDCNGDGISDFVIGAQFTDALADSGGSVHVFSGAD